MSRVAFVLSVERGTSPDGTPTMRVKVDAGDADPSSVEYWAAPGDDSPPLPGDAAQLVETAGTGEEAAVGFADVENAGVAAAGEKRFCGRSPAGAVVVTLWLKGDGSMTIENGAGSFEMGADGSVNINGLVIDALGNLVTPGEVTAKEITPGAGVSLSTHVHPTAATGPVSPPTPGT